MQGSLTKDDREANLCNSAEHGKMFKSFRLGLAAGKEDRRKFKSLEHKQQNPYVLPSEVLELLKKRARWEAGYALGWAIISQRRLAKRRGEPEVTTQEEKKVKKTKRK